MEAIELLIIKPTFAFHFVSLSFVGVQGKLKDFGLNSNFRGLIRLLALGALH